MNRRRSNVNKANLAITEAQADLLLQSLEEHIKIKREAMSIFNEEATRQGAPAGMLYKEEQFDIPALLALVDMVEAVAEEAYKEGG